MTLQENAMAPDFSTTFSDGTAVQFSQLLKEKHIVLYFYPKDFTPGCTQEARDFAQAHSQFEQQSAMVIGISKDSASSHEKFRTKEALPFPLIADESTEICQKFGVWQEKKMFKKVYMGIVRYTFLIEKGGTIKKVWGKVRVKNHVAEVLEELTQLTGSSL